ncbi:sulfur carrier protein ThiS [Haloterrigena salina JCM 13891]|uniref:Sulfur carrier protein ThiS n=1 Tax=Haloterrigena salina JCM 13891 TaxID=1227488 RepID=M0BWD0_9EURY|nr:MoaD/ThiS family protein [Haloterrigena salina]ELZ15270.1 sulfur carrier protein ThiS [Haloterrigena salina JCM 13891]
MEITVYGPVRSATGAKTVSFEFDGGTVADAVAAFVDAYPRAEAHLYDGDDHDELRSSVRVTVDGERATMADRVPADASLTLMPAVQGGTR